MDCASQQLLHELVSSLLLRYQKVNLPGPGITRPPSLEFDPASIYKYKYIHIYIYLFIYTYLFIPICFYLYANSFHVYHDVLNMEPRPLAGFSGLIGLTD